MKIVDIYSKYKIMPSLQLHQLRVAAVATLIAQNVNIKLDIQNIQIATLLHDMGNIIKFKLDLFPDFLKPEGLDYWTDTKNEFIKKYGNDEHLATYKIAKELEISERALELLKSIGFSKAPDNLKINDLEKWIVCYSDHRVTPSKIASLEERMENGKSRFIKNKNISENDIKKYEHDFLIMSTAMKQLEENIFEHSKIKPRDITDKSVESIIEELKKFEI